MFCLFSVYSVLQSSSPPVVYSNCQLVRVSMYFGHINSGWAWGTSYWIVWKLFRQENDNAWNHFCKKTSSCHSVVLNINPASNFPSIFTDFLSKFYNRICLPSCIFLVPFLLLVLYPIPKKVSWQESFSYCASKETKLRPRFPLTYEKVGWPELGLNSTCIFASSHEDKVIKWRIITKWKIHIFEAEMRIRSESNRYNWRKWLASELVTSFPPNLSPEIALVNISHHDLSNDPLQDITLQFELIMLHGQKRPACENIPTRSFGFGFLLT